MFAKQMVVGASAPAVLVWLLSASAVALGAQSKTVAFTNANVIPMDHEGVEQLQTVLVHGDRISAVGSKDQIKVPSDAVVIDCAGQYLVPGLIDAHVHLSGSPLVPTRDNFGDASIYLAYGITTVVNMGGDPTLLEWRMRVKDDTLLGPTIYTAGPFVNEPRVNTPDEVERDIVAQAQLGYDFIKFHELFQTTKGLSRPAYRRMVETARRIGIPLIGHGPVNLGIEEMLRARQSIAHVGVLSNIYFLPFSSHTTTLIITVVASAFLSFLALISAVGTLVRRLSKRAHENNDAVETVNKLSIVIALTTVGAFVCAFTFLPGGPLFDSTFLRMVFTALAGLITVATAIAGSFSARLVLDPSAPTLRKMQAFLLITSTVALSVVLLKFWVPVSWRSSGGGIERVARRVHDAGIFVQSTLIDYDTFSTAGRTALINDPVAQFLAPSTREVWRQEPARGISFNRLTAFMQKVACSLHRNGVPMMAGTDAMGLPLVAPGSSLHREFRLLSESGFSAYEVMRSATVVPAAFLRKTSDFGTIAVGQRADLLLVGGNPLENLTVLERPNGVMIRGRWLRREELDEPLKTLARSE